nr:immunoglobulin heavy chain junction region [Macaca mulatta]
CATAKAGAIGPLYYFDFW